MAKRRKTKVPITVSLKIKELAEQIYDLDIDEVICLLTELDTLYSNNHGCLEGVEWNEALQVWIHKRSQKNISKEIPKRITLMDEYGNCLKSF